MKAILLLADAAQAIDGKVSVLGGGWNQTGSPTPALALTVLIDCPWDQTNAKHKLAITLVDADGRPVEIGRGSMGEVETLQIEAEFETGRPAGVAAGSPLRQVLAINVGAGISLASGKYEFHMTIDGEHMDSWLSTFQVL